MEPRHLGCYGRRGGLRLRLRLRLRKEVQPISVIDALGVDFRMHGTNFMPANNQSVGITSVSTEKRVFKPAKEFSRAAHVRSLADYRKLYNESIRSPEKF